MHVSLPPGPRFGLISQQQQQQIDSLNLPKHWVEELVARFGDDKKLSYDVESFSRRNLGVIEDLKARETDEERNTSIELWFQYGYKGFGDLAYDYSIGFFAGIMKNLGRNAERDMIRDALGYHQRLELIREMPDYTPSDRAFQNIYATFAGIKRYLFPDLQTLLEKLSREKQA